LAQEHIAEGKLPFAAETKKRVLVVDDEHVIADTLTVILRKSGYEAATCYDAKDALEKCTSFDPSLVITDVSMPGMDGIDLAILLTKQFPSCRVLLFSGHLASEDRLEKARLGGHNFELLEKPMDPKILLARVAGI
jgi:DNA-binding response OmpR family regulator